MKWVAGRGFDEVFERAAKPRSHYRPLVSVLAIEAAAQQQQ